MGKSLTDGNSSISAMVNVEEDGFGIAGLAKADNPERECNGCFF